MNPARIASSDWKFQKMLWSMMRLIFKTSSVSPDFFSVPAKITNEKRACILDGALFNVIEKKRFSSLLSKPHW